MLIDEGLLMELKITVTSSVDSTLDKFYPAFDLCFDGPDSKETYHGFRTCLYLNDDISLQLKYGPFQEMIMICESSDGVIGGSNFIWFEFEHFYTIHLNYIFVNEEHRRKGILKKMLNEIMAMSNKAGKPVTLFLEINDPENHIIWGHLGAKILDIDYIQPSISLSTTSEPMSLGVLGDFVSYDMLYSHLYNFFSTSVLKGIDAMDNHTSNLQLQSIQNKFSEHLTYASRIV